MVIKLILSFILIGNLSYADSNAVYLEEKNPAPFSGFLIKEDRVRELRNSELDAKYYKDINESLEKSLSLQKAIIDNKDNQVNILLTQNDKLAKSAYDSQEMNNWQKALYFIGGLAAGFLAVKLAHEIQN